MHNAKRESCGLAENFTGRNSCKNPEFSQLACQHVCKPTHKKGTSRLFDGFSAVFEKQ